MNGVDKRKLMRKTVLWFFSFQLGGGKKKESDYSNQTQLCSGEMSLAVIPDDEAAQTDIDVKTLTLFFFFFCLLTRISPSHPHVSDSFPEGAGGAWGRGGRGDSF